MGEEAESLKTTQRNPSLNDTDAERVEPVSGAEKRILSVMRRRGLALKTERSYLRWYRDYLRWGRSQDEETITPDSLKSYLDYLARKYSNAGNDWRWQWAWPSRVVSRDPGAVVVTSGRGGGRGGIPIGRRRSG